MWQKIKELWEKANYLQKFGLAIIVLILVAIKILKWAIVFKICCGWAAGLWKWLLRIIG